MRTILRLAVLLSALLAAVATPAADLRPFHAEYTVLWKGMSAGRSRLSLQRLADGRWAYESHNAARGLFRVALPGDVMQRSTFRLVDGRVVPDRFFADDGTDSHRRDADVLFDWAAGRATGVAEERKVDVALEPGLQDAMSVQVALIAELLAGRTPERFLMLDRDEVKEYRYTREGAERLRTTLGEHDTVVFRSSRPGSTRGTWFWCAPALGYLPLKVERRNGAKVEWSMSAGKVSVD